MNTQLKSPYFPREGDAKAFALVYDIFWPGDAAEDHRRVEFPGSYITVMNDFLPGLTLEAAGVYYSLSPQEAITLGTLASPFQIGRIIPIEAGMQKRVEGGFSHLYRTRTINTLDITNTAQFTFTYYKPLSTPVMVAIGQDLTNIVPSKIFANHFKYAVRSDLPTTAGSAAISCYHGFNDIVEVSVAITTAANAISIEILQYDEFVQSYQEFFVNPTVFPYNQIFSLPHRNSSRAQVNVVGGGAAETGQILITFTLRPRVT